MNRGEWVRSFVHRKLRRSAGYVDFSHTRLELPFTVSPDENFIGAYLNSQNDFLEAICISDLGLHINAQEAWRFVPYEHIVKSHPPEKIPLPPFVPGYLDVQLHDGEILRLIVRGRTGLDGQFADVYCFESFLAGMCHSIYQGP